MTIPKERGARLAFFDALQRESAARRDFAFAALPLHRAQYKGAAAMPDARGERDTRGMVRNITYELIESQVSVSIPSPRVEAGREGEGAAENARRVEELCRLLRNRLPLEKLNDLDERLTYIYGASVWLAEWDSTLRNGRERGGVRLSVFSPEDFFPQPGVFEVEDMDYLILRYHATRDELWARFGAAPERGEGEEESVCVFLCFYRGDDGAVSRFIWSGNTVLEDVEDYHARKRYVCEDCGALGDGRERICTCGGAYLMQSEGEEVLTREVVTPQGVLPAGTRIPWYVPRHYPVVIRKNTSQEGSVLGQSDCEFIRPQQEEINRVESRIHEKIMASGLFPYKPERSLFQFDNTLHQYVLNLPEGVSRTDFGVLDMMPDLSREQAQSERLYDHAKKLLGITASYQGQNDSSASSGVAKQVQVQQSAGRLESKRVMKNAAYADLDRLFFEYHLAYSEPYPTAKASGFDRYSFLLYDKESDTWYYDDAFLFSADLSGGVEQQRESMWMMNLQNFTSGVYGDPASVDTLLRYWQMQEKAHYPGARENVAYFKALSAKMAP